MKKKLDKRKQHQLDSLKHMSRRPVMPSPKVFADKRRSKKAKQKDIRNEMRDAGY